VDLDALQLPWLVCFSVLVPASVVLAALVDGPDTAPLLARRLTLGGLLLGGLILGGAVALIAGLAAGRSMGVAGGIGAGLLVVLALVPLGRIARRSAVRLLYGERDTPAVLHARLSSRVRAAHAAEDALPTARPRAAWSSAPGRPARRSPAPTRRCWPICRPTSPRWRTAR
jgi:hypothetical protein